MTKYKVWDETDGYYRKSNVSLDECRKLIAHYWDEEGDHEMFLKTLHAETMDELNECAYAQHFTIDKADVYSVIKDGEKYRVKRHNRIIATFKLESAAKKFKEFKEIWGDNND